MKYARPLLIGTFAFALTALVLALPDIGNFRWLVSPTAASANPTYAALIAKGIAQGKNTTAATATLTQTDTATPLPTETPTPTPVPAIIPPTPPPVSLAAFRQGLMLRTDGDYPHAADSFRAVLMQNPDPATARQAHFRLGEMLWLAGDDAGAAPELSAVIAADDTDNLAARSHYFLAQVYKDQKKYSAALDQLRAYRKQTKTLQGEIDGEIGDIILSLGNGQAALDQYNTALKDLTLTAAQRVDLLEKLSDAYKKLGQPAQAALTLGKAFTITPDYASAAHIEYKWGLALDAANDHAGAINHWQHTIGAYPEQDDAYNALVALVDAKAPLDDFQRGLVDYNYGAFDAAIAAFNRYLKAGGSQSATALYYLGRAYLSGDADSLAARALDTLLQNYPNDRHAADAAYYKAKAITNTGDTNGGVAAYNDLAARFPNDARAAEAMYQAARNLDVNGQTDAAQVQYQKFVNAYPKSKYASTALFNIGLDYYFDKDTAHAEQVWKTLAKNYPDTTDADHANFWLGKLAQARGDAANAQAFFKQAAQPPRSYYSYRSLDNLAPFTATPSFDVNAYQMAAQPNTVAEFEKWLSGWTGGTPVSSTLTPALLGDFYFRRGMELAQLDQAGNARTDFARVNVRFKNDARSLYSLARYYQENNYFDLSIQAAQQIQALSGALDNQAPRYLRELIYPTYYADLVVAYAQKYNFDPALFFALMRQESTFNPLAKSWVGAAGLTQVMPSTGQGIARDLRITGFKTSDLLKPYVSVRFGTHFFGQLVKAFDNNLFYSLAGYNAGPGNAKKWQRDDVDIAVEIIHLPETYLYVRTIYSQYNQYLEIYRGR